MNADELAETVWEELPTPLFVDAATVGFVDGSVLADVEKGQRAIESPDGLELLLGERRGVMFHTGEDGACGVEVTRTPSGNVSAIRVDLVNDIAELDGVDGCWSDHTTLTIDTGQVLVCDPFCIHSAKHRVFVPVPNGEHRVQFWKFRDGEILAIRLIVQSSTPSHGGAE